MRLFRRVTQLGLSVLVCLFLAGAVRADAINYSFAGIGQGNLNGTVFASSPFLVSINGDTSNVAFQNNLAALGIENLSGTISISGIGVATFTLPLFVFGGGGADEIGFGNFGQGNLIADFNTGQGLASYALASTFGPVPIINQNLSQFSGVATSLGTLDYFAMSNLTFQSAVTPVPEPSSLLLLGTGMLAVGRLRRRRELSTSSV